VLLVAPGHCEDDGNSQKHDFFAEELSGKSDRGFQGKGGYFGGFL